MAQSVLTPAEQKAHPGWLAWAALGVVYVVWGSTYLAIRFTVESMPPFLAAGTRFLIGGTILALIVMVVAGRSALRMTRAQFGTAVLIGLLLPGWGNGLVGFAELHVASGLAALLVACVPLYVVLMRAAFGDRPPPVTLAGVGVGMVGLGLLLFGGPVEGAHGSAWWGPWVVLIAAFGWSLGSVLSTRLPVPANPFALSAVEMIAGGAGQLVVGASIGEKVDFGTITTQSWWAWGYLVVVGSLFAFSSYVYVLGKLPVSTVATYAYVNPVIAVLLGVLLAGEVFGWAQLGGGLVVLLAVVLVVRAEQGKKRTKELEVEPCAR
ncbi:drug/metabolite transporter (DMT)-like permease [Herbihabitans rhizosphaerae]|uniref:Drug/metabolite transporter (DMT)-like permease n=1 Tax=Herbihabitans rhizosphaerae TaxID=1872711 RepID=A0A4Q7KHV9_9PSEU|nr:EamA family transporter [Herbihabitans rhizosphaerae]RZS34739.1 drug/metabolite transporter (DMT)-like permease [Herbihabitans rhizosphaerae]